MSSQVHVMAPAKNTNASASPRLPQSSLASAEHAQELPDLAQQLDHARRLGHSFGKIGVHYGALPIIQPKLTIGPVNDQYEQEADRVARRVISQINTPAMQRQEKPETENVLQAKPLKNSVQRQEMPEDEEHVQVKPLGNGAQRQMDGSMVATPELETAIQQGRGSGQHLADHVRIPMERAFRADFSGVIVHTDAQADQLNRSIQSRAFTTGQDIFLRQAEYSPDNASGQELLAHELTHVIQQNGRNHTIRRKGETSAAAETTPLLIFGATFEEAAANFAKLLEQNNTTESARIVVVNGPNIRVFDETGKSLSSQFFHLQSPTQAPSAVYRHMPGSKRLHPIVIKSDGSYDVGGAAKVEGSVDFSKDIDDQQGFETLLKGGQHTYYVFPMSTAKPPEADTPPPAPKENLPEFMQFEAKNKSNLPAWPSAVVPLTPQLATVNSMGAFKCMVDKNQGSGTLDRVTNLMQPTSFYWEVLKLDEKLKVKETGQATRWKAAKEGYARRLRDLEADHKTLLGNPNKQSVPENVVRAAMADQVNSTRTILAMAGQTVMTFVNAVTGGSNQLSTEDIIDIPWKEQGDYFVRCLATQVTPKDAKWRRATSVSGVMVSVYNIEDVARESLASPESEKKGAEGDLANVADQIKQIDEELSSGNGDAIELKSKQAYLRLKVDYLKTLGEAAGNPHSKRNAELAYVQAQIAFFKSNAYPSAAKYEGFKKAKLNELEKEEQRLTEEISRQEKRLKNYDPGITQIGYMPALLVDEYTGVRLPLTFVVGERIRVVADELEVVIADVTSAKGKIFSGSGSGFQGGGRRDAWQDAMTDMRKNLGRGRGYVSYQVPTRYAPFKEDLPNPMQLQLGMGAQLKEMVDDTAHVMTLAAIMAAPFTGGASLGILAVLAPIQFGSSLYNVINRSMYSDLELDSEAVMDFINIATLGFGKMGQAGKMASRSVQIVATSSRVALRILNYGQFILITYETYQKLMAEDDPNADPREARRRKLLALMQLFEAAAIPVSEKLWGEARGTSKPKGIPGQAESGPKLLGKEPKVSAGSEEGPHPGKTIEPKTPGEKGLPALEGKTTSPTLTKQQRQAIPKHLQETVVVKESLGRDAKVVYEIGKDGLIKSVELHIGPKTSAADITGHVAVADLMLRYKGLGGKLRRLRDSFINLLSGPANQRPEVGSRAWEARLELIKLDRMMQQRHADLAKYAEEGVRDLTREAQLRDDVDILQQQYDEHAAVLGAIELGGEKGRGYVAAEGLSAGEKMRQTKGYPPAPDGYYWRLRKGNLELVTFAESKPKLIYEEGSSGKKGGFVEDTRPQLEDRFDPGIDRRKAFRELGGYDTTTGLGKFVKMLLDMGVISSRDEVIKALQEPGNLTHRTVRHNVKESFKLQLVDLITKPAYLRKTARYKEVLKSTGDPQQALRAAATEELNRVSKMVESEDRGSIGERVYQKMNGSEKAWQHVQVSKDELAVAKGVDVSEIKEAREFDRMEGNTVREIKNVSTRLGPRERGQIEDMAAMLGSKITYKGQTKTLEKAVVTFQDPVGGKANASLVYDILSIYPDAALTFEFHAKDGSIIKVTAKNKDILLGDKFTTRLGVSEE